MFWVRLYFSHNPPVFLFPVSQFFTFLGFSDMVESVFSRMLINHSIKYASVSSVFLFISDAVHYYVEGQVQ